AEAAERARDRDELLVVVEAVADTLQVERAILVGAAAVDIAQALADEWLEAGNVAGQRGGDARLIEGQDLFEGLGIGHGVSGVGPGWTSLYRQRGAAYPPGCRACSGRGALPPVGERGAGRLAEFIEGQSLDPVAGTEARRGDVDDGEVSVDARDASHAGERIAAALDDLGFARLGAMVHHHEHPPGAG